VEEIAMTVLPGVRHLSGRGGCLRSPAAELRPTATAGQEVGTTPPAGRGGGAAWSWPRAARAALRDLVPALIALAPLGVVVGVTVRLTAVSTLVGVGSAPTVFAGTAQLSILTLLQSGAGVLTIVVSATLINARILLYAAVLEPDFRDQPGWFRWLGPHFLVDPTFALVTARHDLDSPERFRRYWVSMGALFVLAWTGLVAVGAVVGPGLAGIGPVLGFAPVAVFLPLLVPRLGNRPGLVAALAAGVVTGVASATGALPAGTPVLLGAMAGVLAAVVVQGRAA
jgi:predicted branched-subunit amino acid permease